jgi:hypothetical protein
MGFSLDIGIRIITAVIAVIALLFTAAQIRATKNWNRQNATYNYCMEYRLMLKTIGDETKELFHLLDYQEAPPTKEAVRRYLDDTTQREDLFIVMEYFEKLCVGIKNKYFDEKVARSILEQALTITYANLRPYIEVRREETGQPICQHIETIGNKWLRMKR